MGLPTRRFALGCQPHIATLNTHGTILISLLLNYRKAKDEDIEWLLDLRVETMGPHLIASGKPLSIEEQRERLLQNYEHIEVIICDSDDVGMVKTVKGQGHWELVQIQMKPHCQNRGFGSEVIRKIISEAQFLDIPLTLSVLKVNPAKRLYDKLGFNVVGETSWSYKMSTHV